MKNVQDLYPPTPMQRVMLLHAMAAAGLDTLHNQFCYEVRGELDVGALERAWQRVVDRHDSLRTAFLWDELDSPLQVVRANASLPFEVLDWGGAGRDCARERSSYLERDRGRGFDLAKAPLMRIALARCSEEVHCMIWSSHHLVLDRWCTALVLEELARCYDAERRGEEPLLGPAPGRFSDYVRWIHQQDEGRAADYWRERVFGVDTAARSVGPRSADATDARRGSTTFDGESAEAIRELARSLRVTPNTLFQGAWALLLNQRGERQDVVFGATVSGRPPELPGVESTVGSFVSNVPVRVSLPEGEPVGSWLQRLHREQQERSPYEFFSAAEIQELSGLPSTEPLFDSLLVWLAPVEAGARAGLELRALGGSVRTTWPVTVSISDGVGPSRGIRVDLEVAAGWGSDPEELLSQLRDKVVALSGAAQLPLGELAGFVRDVPAPNGAARASAPTAPVLSATTVQAPGAAAGREAEELDMVEQLVLTECRAALGHDEVRLRDNFFEIGGNSLLAVHVHLQFEKIMARSIPILPLFQSTSLGEMARFLTEGEWPMRTEVVRAVQPHGTRTPLFCLSSPEVNSIGYVLLARYLDPEQPLYLVQSPPESDEVLRMAITQIPETADRYFEALRETRPHGPYRLLGMCEGALVAVEVAKRLRAAGEEVEFVGILNTYSLNTLSKRNYVRRAEVRLRYYAGRLVDFCRLSGRAKRGELSRVLRDRVGAFGSVLGDRSTGDARRNAATSGAEPEAFAEGETCVRGETLVESEQVSSRPTLDSVHREWQELDWPGRIPDSPKFDGNVSVFRIRRQPYFRIRDEALGWRQHAQSVDVVHLRTRAQDSLKPDLREWREAHLDVLREPDVRETAAAVAAALKRLDGAPRS